MSFNLWRKQTLRHMQRYQLSGWISRCKIQVPFFSRLAPFWGTSYLSKPGKVFFKRVDTIFNKDLSWNIDSDRLNVISSQIWCGCESTTQKALVFYSNHLLLTSIHLDSCSGNWKKTAFRIGCCWWRLWKSCPAGLAKRIRGISHWWGKNIWPKQPYKGKRVWR